MGADAVPYVDPVSGGIRSRVMFLLEAPGRAAAHRKTLLSPDNDDPPAANVWRLYGHCCVVTEDGRPGG